MLQGGDGRGSGGMAAHSGGRQIPIALVLAWAFELTLEGVKRFHNPLEKPADARRAITLANG